MSDITHVNKPTTPLPTPEQPVPEKRGLSVFAWLLIIVVVLVAILAIAHFGIAVFIGLEQPVSGASGTLLYATTFDDFPNEWSQFEGQMSSTITDGSLRIAVNATNDGAFSILNYTFASFDARLSATRLSAEDEYNELGLLFRYQSPTDFYMFKIRADGHYRVERRKAGTTEVLSEWHLSPVLANGLNVPNQLRIVAKGDQFAFYINGTQMLLCPSGPDKQKSTWQGDQCLSNNAQTAMTLQDTTFAQGKIGAAVRVGVPGIEVAFDDVVVYAP